MTQASANNPTPESTPGNEQPTPTPSNDIPELEPFDEDELAAVFDRLEGPKKS